MPRRRNDGRRAHQSGDSSPLPEDDLDEEHDDGEDEWYNESDGSGVPPLLHTTRRARTPQQRFRGGPPPTTPGFTPDSKDPQAFRKWERKVQVWKREISKYMEMSQAGLRLYVAFSRDAEEETRYLVIDQIDDGNGVDYIVEAMRRNFAEKNHPRKSKLLTDHERIRRYAGESTRAYINRYKRVELALREIGINIAASYDAEARGHGLLETAMVGPTERRNIITMIQDVFEFNLVADALVELFPDSRPPPACVTASGLPVALRGKGAGKGGDNRSPNTNKAFLTNQSAGDQPAAAAAAAEPPLRTTPRRRTTLATTWSRQRRITRTARTTSRSRQLEELYEVMSVTAKKLKHLTQARGWSAGAKRKPGTGIPKTKEQRDRDIADRKKNSDCAACGERGGGHWQGDAECKGPKAASSGRTNSTHVATIAEAGRSGDVAGDYQRQESLFTTFVNECVSVAYVLLLEGHSRAHGPRHRVPALHARPQLGQRAPRPPQGRRLQHEHRQREREFPLRCGQADRERVQVHLPGQHRQGGDDHPIVAGAYAHSAPRK